MARNPILAARARRSGIYLFATAWLVLTIYPLVFLIQNSLKARSDFFQSQPWSLPSTYEFGNYWQVIEAGFFRYLGNSFFVVGVSLVIIIIVGSLAAYGLARVKFRLRTLLYFVFVGGLTIPIHITLIPVYQTTRAIGLYDTLPALIGPFVAVSLPITVFILTAFMQEFPRSIEESAFMDGANRLRVYWHIVLPMTRPAVTAVGILNAVVLWNEFVFPLVLISSREYRPLTLALWDFQGEFSTNIPLMMAALVLASLPLFLAYAIAREKLIEGVVVGAIKG